MVQGLQPKILTIFLTHILIVSLALNGQAAHFQRGVHIEANPIPERVLRAGEKSVQLDFVTDVFQVSIFPLDFLFCLPSECLTTGGDGCRDNIQPNALRTCQIPGIN